MKVKEIKYIICASLKELQSQVNYMLDAGWEPFGYLIIGHDYAQAMVKYKEAKSLFIAVGNNEELKDKINLAIADGAKLCGYPFAVGNYLCQGLVRVE